MYRATTPLHRFVFADDPSAYPVVKVTYAQGKRTIIEKDKEDLEFSSYTIPSGATRYTASLRLTQEETKLFTEGNTVMVQVRVLDESGHSYASDVVLLTVKDVLNDEVLR